VKIRLEIDERTVRTLIENFLAGELGPNHYDCDKIRIEVRSQQNYKAEWEKSDFRAIYEHDTSIK
jgi:hypothetical protein